MTEEFKGRGLTPHNLPWGGGYPEDFVEPAVIHIDSDLKEKLDASLTKVREDGELVHLEIPVSEESQKVLGRGMSKHFVTYDSVGYYAKATDENGYPVEDAQQEIPDPITLAATVNINNLDLENDMIAKGAKQIMANELNLMFAEQGIKTHYTPEMLSALAAERLRAEQKRKKKARINKRKRK